MSRQALALLVCASGLSLAGPGVSRVHAQQAVSYARDIQPILQHNCATCHGAIRTSGFDVRSRETAMRGGDHGVAIVPGNAEQSRLYRRVAGLEQPAMPFERSPLTPEQIAALKAWIDQGAQWDATPADATAGANALAALENTPVPPAARNYWAFKLPVQSPVPVVSSQAKHPVDRFL
jgi:mono/diheme cytochrome c family protein